MDERPVKTFYRAIKTIPPTDKDYVLLFERKGHPSPDLPEEVRNSYYAFSAYDNITGLQEQARRIRGMGRHIYRYDIPEGAGIVWKQTIAPGHYDLWGDKETLKQYLVGYVCDVWDDDVDIRGHSGAGDAMTYDLWDTEVSRYLGHFDDEREALSLVHMLLSHHGVDYAADLGLGRATDDGEVLEPLSGATLIARISEVLPGLQSVESGAETVIVPST